ncbi:MAG: response regulator [Colwellia sp.]|nr:response regulator [Colwellia sp.]
MNKALSPIQKKWRQLAWVSVLVICFIPLLLNILGFDFASTISPINAEMLATGQIHSEQLFGAVAGAIHHALLEWSAVTLATMVAIASFMHYRIKRDVTVPIIGLALLSAGAVDAFHTLAATRIISASAPNTDFIPFTWALSRIFNALIMIIAAVSSLWLSKNRLEQRGDKLGFKIIFSAAFLFISLAALVVFSAASSDSLPKTMFPDALITRPYDVLPLALFLCGGVLYWLWYNDKSSVLRYALLLSIIPEVVTQFHMAFGSVSLFDNHFNIAHFLKNIAYGSIFLGILFDLSQNNAPAYLTSNRDTTADTSGDITADTRGDITADTRGDVTADARLLKIDSTSSSKVIRSLAFKIPLAGFVFSLVISLIIGSTFYIESKQLVIEKELEELKIESQVIKPLIQGLYLQSAKDITLMANMPPIQGIIKAIEQQNNGELQLWRQRLQLIYSELLKTKPIFKKISYLVLGDNIHSVASVEQQLGSVRIVPDNELAQNVTITSLSSALSNEESQVTISNVEFIGNKLTSNEQAPSSIFVGMPVYSNSTGKMFGMIAIEVDFTKFITELKASSFPNINFYLANHQRDFIFNPEASLAQITTSLFTEFPHLRSVISQDINFHEINETSIIDGKPLIASYSAIDLSEFGQLGSLHLLIKSNTDSYINAVKNMRLRAILIGISLAILSLGLSILASKRLIYPLTQMTDSLYQYDAKGEVGELPINERDETGVLARSFHNILIKIDRQSAQQRIETERAEDATNKLQAILNSIVDAIININDKGHIIAFNSAAEKMFGYKEKEIIEENISVLLPRGFSREHDEYMQEFLKSHETKIDNKGREFPALRKDGEIFTMNLSISRVMTTGGVLFTYLIRDITEQKLLEADKKRSIQEAENMAWRLNFALSAPKIGVWDYNITTGNSTWDERMYILHEMVFNDALITEEQWLSFVHQDDLELVEEFLKFSSINAEDFHFEYRIILPNKEVKYIECHAQVLKDDYEKNIRVVGTNRDITEQHNLQVLKQQALNMAEDALRLRSEFLASMSHEIRTPMNGVLGMLNLLEQSKLTKQQHHHVQLASSSGQSLLLLINDILDFSKIEAGKLDLEVLDFDIRSQLGEFAESMAIKAQEKGLEIILDVTKIKYAMVKGDPSRLRQILTNLVGNSIKFTDSGEIVIKAFINEYNDRLQLTCSVADTGIGIPDNKVNSLFDSFTQVDASTTRKYGGTGLGLAIVKQLCQLMDGAIEVISSYGHGSEFTFTLFLDKSDLASQMMPRVDIKGTKILIVDDNSTNLEVLKGQLEIWGAEVTQAQDGFAALNIIEQHPESYFKLAILDMQMPGMDGATLGNKLQEGQRSTDIKLVMMTSMAERGDAAFFADLGFSAYFPKPTTTSDLFDALSVVLENKQALNDANPLVTHHNLRSLTQHSSNKKAINKKARILLVEDNRINQVVLLGVLSNLGLSADVAGNGLEALAALMSSPDDAAYQLIIMDCQMPEMDGYEATRAIRAGKTKELYNDIPIIAMTANAMKGDKEKCLIAGMSDYATKPVDAEGLYEKLLHWIGEDSEDNQQEVVAQTVTTGETLSKLISAEELSTSIKNQQEIVAQDKDQEADSSNVIWDKEGFLKRVRNNEKMAKKLIAMFIEDMPQVKDELCTALADKELSEVISFAHKLTGTTSNLGGVSLAKLTKNVELNSIEEGGDNVEQLIKKIEKEYKLFHQEISSFL